MGIRGIGEGGSATLAARYGTLQEVAAAARDGQTGLGELTDRLLQTYFLTDRATILVEYFTEQGFACCRPPVKSTTTHKPFAGLSVVVTGELANYDRNQAKDAIRSLGGTPSDSVSKKTGYLIVGNAPGSKLDKAKALGTKILDEAAFEAVMGGGEPQPLALDQLPSRNGPAVTRPKAPDWSK